MEDGLISEFPAGVQFKSSKVGICFLVEGHERRVSYVIGLQKDNILVSFKYSKRVSRESWLFSVKKQEAYLKRELLEVKGFCYEGHNNVGHMDAVIDN
jgi:hypothetical protein